MKKLIALLAVFLGVALLLGLLWRLATGNTSHQQTNAGSNDLFSAAVERVEEYADNFSNGWDDLAWANARGYIAGRSTVASASGATVFSDEEISLLHDKFAVSVLEKLYSHIASQLNARTPKMSVAGNSVLKRDYRGLDSLAKYYAAIPPTAKYQELKKTRSALDGAYSFAMQNFAVSPCMKPSLSFSAPSYSLAYSRPFDYAAYGNRVEQGGMLSSLHGNKPPCLLR